VGRVVIGYETADGRIWAPEDVRFVVQDSNEVRRYREALEKIANDPAPLALDNAMGLRFARIARDALDD
jgi:hypothetical protein